MNGPVDEPATAASVRTPQPVSLTRLVWLSGGVTFAWMLLLTIVVHLTEWSWWRELFGFSVAGAIALCLHGIARWARRRNG